MTARPWLNPDDLPDPIECPECAGSGIYRRRTWVDPEEACPVCDGSGVRDCNCPGLCHVHEAHTIPAAPARPWLIPDPWSKPTAPEPAY